jgi:hypothetical protein
MNEIIDFDLASREWRKNKVSLGNGYFGYRCNYTHSNGKKCNKVVSKQKIQPRYRIREDWITKAPQGSLEYCQRHIIRGPIKDILSK